MSGLSNSPSSTYSQALSRCEQIPLSTSPVEPEGIYSVECQCSKWLIALCMSHVSNGVVEIRPTCSLLLFLGCLDQPNARKQHRGRVSRWRSQRGKHRLPPHAITVVIECLLLEKYSQLIIHFMRNLFMSPSFVVGWCKKHDSGHHLRICRDAAVLPSGPICDAATFTSSPPLAASRRATLHDTSKSLDNSNIV